MDDDSLFVILLALIFILFSSCGGWQEPVIRKSPGDAGYSLLTEIEKINSRCIQWETGYYVTPTGLKTYEFCTKFEW